MSAQEAISIILKRWKLQHWIKILLAWVAIATFSGLLIWTTNIEMWTMIPAVATALWLGWKELRRLPKQEDVVRLLNEQVSSLQFSSAIFLQGDQNGIAQLQRRRIVKELLDAGKKVKFPVVWRDLGFGFISLCVIFWLASFLPSSSKTDANISIKQQVNSNPSNASTLPKPDSIFIEAFEIIIEPLAYTGMAAKEINTWNVEAPEGAMLTWKLVMAGNPSAVWTTFNQKDSIPFVNTGKNWILKRSVEDLIYSIHFTDAEGNVTSSAFHSISSIQDQAPKVAIKNVPQFQRLDFAANISIPLEVEINDDYGLTDGYIVATITKGSGESVKFREQKIPFSEVVRGKSFNASLELNTADFDMEPGNELYFYAYAEDNRHPTVLSARTETHFFILNDTTEVEFSLQGALGVDLMPDYFRSQLQIIIDTKKLIEEERDLTKHEFNSRSNALGFDQKSLRLKYGQFIGEEEDSGLEAEREVPEAEEHDHDDHEGHDHEEENVVMRFGHDTDHENEEGEWMDRGTEHEHRHDHGAEGIDPEAEEDPLEGFLHNHEDEETATFYTQSLKSKLRAALTQMWDAELYLRLYQPEKSLPYQLEAQELLKEIRNHARIYVQRIGFDPPTVNEEETRLTGKLDELNDRSFENKQEVDQRRETILEGVKVLDQLIKGAKLDEPKRRKLEEVGAEIALMVLNKPGEYLFLLNRIRGLIDTKSAIKAQDLIRLSYELAATIPPETKPLNGYSKGDDEFTNDFLNQLINSSSQ